MLAGGWGELHYLTTRGELPATHLMIYGPRDSVEADSVWKILQASHAFARGSSRRSSCVTHLNPRAVCDDLEAELASDLGRPDVGR